MGTYGLINYLIDQSEEQSETAKKIEEWKQKQKQKQNSADETNGLAGSSQKENVLAEREV